MSLYGDLPKARENISQSSDDSPWLSATLISGSSIASKKSATAAASSSTITSQKHLIPLPSHPLWRQAKKRSKAIEDANDTEGMKERNIIEQDNGLDLNFFGDIKDEYDPAKPNDYETVMKEREKKRQEAEKEVARQEEIRKEIERQEEEQRIAKEMLERQREREIKERALAESEENLKNKKRLRPISPLTKGKESAPTEEIPSFTASSKKLDVPQTTIEKGMTLAQKMLEKFGWREGDGLGKERQGMATPLIAQKTDRRSAVIINAELKKSQAEALEIKRQKILKAVSLEEKKTKVILLRNLVGPGEVDDSLEDEVANEAQNYGKVLKVLIFEVTESNFPSDEAIRIFIEFEKIEEATKAVVAMQGRFFGGRTVKAGFYDEDKFNKCDLAPLPGEYTLNNS